MRVLTKVLAAAATVVVAVPLIAFIVYDVVAFQPHRAHIQRALSLATPEERSPPVAVAQLVRAAHGNRLSARASRLLLQELEVNPESGGMLYWHTTSVLWWALVALHHSEQEQLTLIASRSYMGNGIYGFTGGGMALFGRPLSALSLNETATVVAVPHAPTAYLSSPERLAKRRDFLVEKLQRGL